MERITFEFTFEPEEGDLSYECEIVCYPDDYDNWYAYKVICPTLPKHLYQEALDAAEESIECYDLPSAERVRNEIAYSHKEDMWRPEGSF